MPCVFCLRIFSLAHSHKDSFLYLLPKHLQFGLLHWSLQFVNKLFLWSIHYGEISAWVSHLVLGSAGNCPSPDVKVSHISWMMAGTSPVTPGTSIHHLSLLSFFDLMPQPSSYNLFCGGVCMSMSHTPTPSDRNELCSFFPDLLPPQSLTPHEYQILYKAIEHLLKGPKCQSLSCRPTALGHPGKNNSLDPSEHTTI